MELLKAVTMLRTLFTENKLNKKVRGEILKTLDCLLPKDHCIPKSNYQFEKFFSVPNYEKKYICLKCNEAYERRYCELCNTSKESHFSVSCSFDIMESVQKMVVKNSKGKIIL